MKKFVWLLAIAMMIPYGASAQVGTVGVELSVDQEQYMPDEDLVISLQILNRSGQTLEFGKSADWVRFTIEDDNNRMVPSLGELPTKGEFSLKSSEMGTKRFNLTPYFFFRQPGHYRVIATVKMPEWNKEISSKALVITIMNGVPLANFPELEFGVPLPAGVTNGVPETRKYVLQKATYVNELRLYFRLTDSYGKTLKIFPIGRMVSFGQPDVRMDASNNLHVLHQFYAKSFSYCVISPEGQQLIRQTHDFTQTKPSLRTDSEGRVFVAGGVRRVTAYDWPVPTATAFPTNNNVTNQ